MDIKDFTGDGLNDLLKGMTPSQIADLKRNFDLEVRMIERTMLPDHEIGTPKDPAVQKAAAEWLLLRRRPEFRQKWLRSFGDEVSSYEEIAKDLRVSRERVRQLYAELCPLEYEEDADARKRTNTRIGRVRQVG